MHGLEIDRDWFELLSIMQENAALISDRYIQTGSGRRVPKVTVTLEFTELLWRKCLAHINASRPTFRLVDNAILRP
ncbi:hypothetical protein GV827_07030 [Sulfitobacter sp. JBTF-M27]|uniref:Uncharacterized protein n=1 Tax=Sulfitobacter sediminilitoris TaxID=2698830 RepID=A0A6P0C7J1_9RHOB|nr:hypothetical protein [Sulfitobacter sediminilitoris]NEK22151.1 hypothetical protein [Sulfitobacter sediminilitoris]